MSGRIFTAAQLASDWWWDEDFQARILGSEIKWDSVAMTRCGGSIRLMRLDTNRCRAFRQYVKPDTRMRLVAKV